MEYQGFDEGFSVSGKVALVTGAAAGIGNAVSRMFARKGARVVLLDRDPSVTGMAAEVAGDDAVGIVVDVTDAEDVERAVAEAEAQIGPADILVNSAGIVELEPAEDFSEANWDRTLDVNLKGTYLMCQAVGRRMLGRNRGRIVNMASKAGVVGLDKHLAYCASKGGVISLTQVLALEWSPRGVQVNAVSPTVVMTELGRRAWAGEVGERLKEQLPARRFAEPDEVAAAILYLASDAAAMVTGANLVIDGGYSIQ